MHRGTEIESEVSEVSTSAPANAAVPIPVSREKTTSGREKTVKRVAKSIARGLRSIGGFKKKARGSKKNPGLNKREGNEDVATESSRNMFVGGENSEEISQTTSLKSVSNVSRNDASEAAKKSSNSRIASPPQRVAEGDRVFGAVETTSKGVVYWFPGIASRVYKDGKADVSFDDDSRMTSVRVCRVAEREYNMLKDFAPRPGDQVFGMEEENENDGEMLWRLATVCEASDNDTTSRLRQSKLNIRVLYHGDDSATPRIPELIWCVSSSTNARGGNVEIVTSPSSAVAGDPYFWDKLSDGEEEEEELRRCAPGLPPEITQRRKLSLDERARSAKLYVGGVPRTSPPPRMPPSPHGAAIGHVNENDMAFEDVHECPVNDSEEDHGGEGGSMGN